MIYYLYECSVSGREIVTICQGSDGLDLEKLQMDFVKELVGDPPPSYKPYDQSPENNRLREAFEKWLNLRQQRCTMDLFMKRHGLKSMEYREVECVL